MNRHEWVVYLVRCSDDSLYCGITNNLKSRLAAHNSGSGAKYTRSRRPVYVVGISSKMTHSKALKLEHRVKQVPAGKKLMELSNEEGSLVFKALKEIQAISQELKVLSKKVEKLGITIEKIERYHLSG